MDSSICREIKKEREKKEKSQRQRMIGTDGFIYMQRD